MVTATLRLIRTSSEPANPPAANRYSTRIDECLAQCQFGGFDEGRSGPSGVMLGDLQHRDFCWFERGRRGVHLQGWPQSSPRHFISANWLYTRPTGSADTRAPS